MNPGQEASTKGAGVLKKIRKIIHVDMDAFYASVEQRDNPAPARHQTATGLPRSSGVSCTTAGQGNILACLTMARGVVSAGCNAALDAAYLRQ